MSGPLHRACISLTQGVPPDPRFRLWPHMRIDAARYPDDLVQVGLLVDTPPRDRRIGSHRAVPRHRLAHHATRFGDIKDFFPERLIFLFSLAASHESLAEGRAAEPSPLTAAASARTTRASRPA